MTIYCGYIFLLYSCWTYNHPSPEDDIVREYVALLCIELDRSSKAYCTKHRHFTIPFRFDVFKFLFKDYNKNLYSHDFDPSKGDQFSKEDNSDDSRYGHKIVFPLKVRLSLQRSPPNGFIMNPDGTYTPKPRPLAETLSVQAVKANY